MNLGFTWVNIKNFKTIKSMQFNFDRKVGVHLIGGSNRTNKRLGSNGAGKSSIFDALCWCLYGKTPDGKRGPDLIPWTGGGMIKVYTKTLDGHQIFRTHNPNRLTYDGSVVDQDRLDQHLGMGFDTFCHTMLLGQSLPLFFDLTPTAKMQLFNDVLDLERWTVRSKRARDKANDLHSRVDELNGWLGGSGARLDDMHVMLSKVKSFATAWDKNNEVNRAGAEKELKEVEKIIAGLQDIHDKNDLAYDGAMTEIKPIRVTIETAERVLREQDKRLLHEQTKLNQMKVSLEGAEKGICPTCQRPWKSPEHFKDLKLGIKQLTSEVRSRSAAVHGLGVQLDNQRKALSQFQSKADEARDALDKCIPRLAEAKATQSRMDEILRTLETPNPHREQLQDLRKAVKKLEREIDEKEEQCAKLGRAAIRNEFWVKEFKNVELYLIDDVLQELEIATAIMLDQLGLVGWSVHYRTEAETKAGTIKRGLTVFIQSPDNKKPVRWECWSGGEKQRLRIMGALALSEVLLARAGIEPTMEILDEPSSHLSSEGVEDLCQFLADRAKHLDRNIYFVDQTVVESALFRSTIDVTRSRDKGTTLGD